MIGVSDMVLRLARHFRGKLSAEVECRKYIPFLVEIILRSPYSPNLRSSCKRKAGSIWSPILV